MLNIYVFYVPMYERKHPAVRAGWTLAYDRHVIPQCSIIMLPWCLALHQR